MPIGDCNKAIRKPFAWCSGTMEAQQLMCTNVCVQDTINADIPEFWKPNIAFPLRNQTDINEAASAGRNGSTVPAPRSSCVFAGLFVF